VGVPARTQAPVQQANCLALPHKTMSVYVCIKIQNKAQNTQHKPNNSSQHIMPSYASILYNVGESIAGSVCSSNVCIS